MKTLKVMVMAVTMSTMILFGGAVNMTVTAEDVSEDVSEVVEVVPDSENLGEDVSEDEPTSEPTEVTPTEAKPLTAKQIIERDTHLVVDKAREIDHYKGKWYAYYCYCDGDIYCITINDGSVDVVAQLN